MRELPNPSTALLQRNGVDSSPGAFSLLEVLWWRRHTVILCVAACLALVGCYLLVASRVYRATATVLLEEQTPTVLAEASGPSHEAEAYLETQADVMRSAGVLSTALQHADWRSMKTFSGVKEPVLWLQKGNDFKVEIPKRKSSVVVVSMDSRYPREAARLVNCVIDAYKTQQSRSIRDAGTEMQKVLEQERLALEQKRQDVMKQMIACKQNNGVLSFHDDRANTILQSTSTLATDLTAAQVAMMELRAKYQAALAASSDPASLSAYVLAQSLKTQEFADREYDDLHTRLVDLLPALADASANQGSDNPRVQSMQSVATTLRDQLAQRERVIARANLVGLKAQLDAAEHNEAALRAALDAQWKQALALNPAAAQYARLESDSAQLEKQGEMLDGRMAEIIANHVNAPPLNATVVDAAYADNKPVKPNVMLCLLGAVLMGWVGGIGLAMVREWQDARIRSPEEISVRLGTPLIALVPRINGRLSSVARGQVMQLDSRSPVAEAFRSARTSLQLGQARAARKILVTSPGPGDGKSTTASNLAIALAQGGLRTLLIDCDLRAPVQHMIFETEIGGGLSEVMAGAAKVRTAIRATRICNLFVLPSGTLPLNPAELLSSERFSQLMQTLAASFDRIVIDSPPMCGFSDARILSVVADATLLVFRMNQSVRRLGAEALDDLEKVGANVLGAIANEVSPRRNVQYYGGSWHYAESAERLLLTNGAAPSGRLSKTTNGTAAAHHQHVEVPAIEEPEWCVDMT